MSTRNAGPTRDIREVENVWIPLADGARLAARIWLPVDALESPVPAVLEYLPYRKSDATVLDDLGRHPYFAAHGYAAVRVDLRGTGDSDGLLRGEYLPQEQDDALEVLAWLESRPWCTGAVGMIGYSWGGFNGLQVAARRPSQLRAVITVASTDDRYLDDCHYMGGCLLGSDMLKWAASMLTYALQPPDPRHVGRRWRDMWLDRLENAPELAHDWIGHQLRDDFWKHGSVAEDYGSIGCPVMVVGGWADAYTNSVPRLLEHLRVPRIGIIGPWAHMMPHQGVPGPAIDFLREAVRWWDLWLKDIDSGIMGEPLLRVWLQEHVRPAAFHSERPGRWIAQGSWPPAGSASLVLALDAGGSLAPVEEAADRTDRAGLAGATQISVTHSGAEGGTRMQIRGKQECGETAGVWCANGYADELAVDQNPDDALSLCYTTQPLSEQVEVLGHPVVDVRLAVDRSLALVAARVEDVAPDCSSLLVSWGMLNLAHREGHMRAEALDPGRPYDVRIECRVCGHRFAAGHRIRLALSPTYWPHAWPSPEPVTLTVEVGGPSVLSLPVFVPSGGTEVTTGGARADRGAHTDRRDERLRQIRVEREMSRHEIVDRESHERTLPSGIRYSERATDTYSIVEEDPLSARVRCTRETSSDGPDGSWRVTLNSEMTSDPSSFLVSEEYAAFDGETRLFSRARSYRIARTGV